jgi:hypothetical protein
VISQCMKKIIPLLFGLLFIMDGYTQDIDRFIGEYVVPEIRSAVLGGTVYTTDTMSYFNTIKKYNDTLITISFFAGLDTVKATVISDSIDIFRQTIYFDEMMYYIIKGSGRLYDDTLKFNYTNGGQFGSFIGNCIAVKKKSSSENVTQNSKFIKCYPNPSFDLLHFETEIPTNIAEAVVTIYSLSGAIVKRVNLTKRGAVRQDIDLSDLDKGSYLIELKMDNWNKKYSRIVKAK